MLAIDHLDAGYRHVRVLHDVSLAAAPGEAVGVLGPNGAGKTTLLRAIAGTCSVYGGRIAFAGQPLDGKPDHARAALGIAHVPEGRRIWPSLTVEENLLIGAWRLPRAARKREAPRLLDYVIDLFPRLRARMRVRAAMLSGGEQQMLAIGRGLMAKPTLMLIDEPSIGLAPIMVEAVMAALQRLRQNQDLAIVLVEQRIPEVLELCNRIYILNRGRMLDSGQRREALTREAIEDAYFEGR
jgi:branched-chain amino acid transport system ATP-binding protein